MKILIIILLLMVVLIPFAYANNIVVISQFDSLADLVVDSTDPNTNLGTLTNMDVDKFVTLGEERRIYISFLLTNPNIPTNISLINNAYFNITTQAIIAATSAIFNISVYEVYNNVTTWNENITGWNNQSCGTGFYNYSNCNLTEKSRMEVNSTALDSVLFNITTIVVDALVHGRKNISFVLKSNSTNDNNFIKRFKSKENPTEGPTIIIESIIPAGVTSVVVYDEFLGSPATISPVAADFVASNYSFNKTITGNSSIPVNYPLSYRVSYSSPSFKKRDYYVDYDADANPRTLILYLLSTTNGTDVTFTIEDQSGQAIDDALVKLLRYYVANNSYIPVAMAKTDLAGQAIIDVELNSAFYQLAVSKNSSSVVTIGQRIYSRTPVIRLNLISDVFAAPDAIEGLKTTLTFNNATQTFTYSFNDIGAASRTVSLNVVRRTSSGDITVCTNSATGASGTLLCQYNMSLNHGYYFASGGITSIEGIPTIPTNMMEIVTDTIQQGFRQRADKSGVYLSFILGGTFAGLGSLASPATAIIMFMVGLGVILYFNLTALTLGIYLTIFIISLFLILKVLRT